MYVRDHFWLGNMGASSAVFVQPGVVNYQWLSGSFGNIDTDKYSILFSQSVDDKHWKFLYSTDVIIRKLPKWLQCLEMWSYCLIDQSL